MNRAATITVLFLFAVGGGCDVGNPPVRTGESLLEMGNAQGNAFGGTPFNQVLLQYYLGQPFDTWSFRGTELTSDANTAAPGAATTTQPFDLTQYPLSLTGNPTDGFAQYRSVHAFWRYVPRTRFEEFTQHETLLFARDPEETFETILAIPVNYPIVNVSLRAELTANRWPDSATLVYPPRPNWDTAAPPTGPEPIHAFLSTYDFWQQGTTPEGPGSLPTLGIGRSGPGSVKNIMVVNHGLCSQLVPYNDMPDPSNPTATRSGIFPSLPTQLMTAIELGIAESGQTAAVTTLDKSDVVAFLHSTDDRDPAPQGGFVLAFYASFQNVGSLPVVGSVNATATYSMPYVFKLLDGRLTVDPLRNAAETAAFVNPIVSGLEGPIAAQLQESLDGVLLQSLTKPLGEFDGATSLAATVFQQADQKQEFPGIPGQTCTPLGPQNDRIPVSADPTSGGMCSAFFGGMFTALHNALFLSGHFGSFAGIPNSAFDQLWNDTALATDPTGQFYKNVRCVPRTLPNSTEVGNFCRYVMPARRINVLPDGVELVFVDDDKEYTNPSFIPWLILEDSGLPFATGLGQMCDPPHFPTSAAGVDNFLPGRRPFGHAITDNKTFSAFGCLPLGGGLYCQVQVQ